MAWFYITQQGGGENGKTRGKNLRIHYSGVPQSLVVVLLHKFVFMQSSIYLGHVSLSANIVSLLSHTLILGIYVFIFEI